MATSLDDRIQFFCSTKKIAVRRARWKARHQSDFAVIVLPVADRENVRVRGRLIITAHLSRVPQKLSFNLLYGDRRVLGLDVNPGRWHRNILTGASVSVTHWQKWPLMEAEEDRRVLAFAEWLGEFISRANIELRFKIAAPPFGVQLELGQWPLFPRRR